VYLVHQSEPAQMQSFVLAERMRDAGLDVVLHCATAAGVGSFKSQMKRADASGAAFAVIVGEDEMTQGKAKIKALRADDQDNNQTAVPFDTVVDYLVDQITGHDDHDHENCTHTHH
jgi:histidyl-tRNA synthetase